MCVCECICYQQTLLPRGLPNVYIYSESSWFRECSGTFVWINSVLRSSFLTKVSNLKINMAVQFWTLKHMFATSRDGKWSGLHLQPVPLKSVEWEHVNSCYFPTFLIAGFCWCTYCTYVVFFLITRPLFYYWMFVVLLLFVVWSSAVQMWLGVFLFNLLKHKSHKTVLILRCRQGRDVDPGGCGGLEPLIICRRGQSMFWPPKMSHSFKTVIR